MERTNQITVDVGPRLRARMDEAKKRRGEFAEPLKDSQIVRDALLLWSRESPYALDPIEMWLLRASRAAREKEKGAWAGAILGLNNLIFGKEIPLEVGIEASLSELSKSRPEQQDADASSRPLRAARKR